MWSDLQATENLTDAIYTINHYYMSKEVPGSCKQGMQPSVSSGIPKTTYKAWNVCGIRAIDPAEAYVEFQARVPPPQDKMLVWRKHSLVLENI